MPRLQAVAFLSFLGLSAAGTSDYAGSFAQLAVPVGYSAGLGGLHPGLGYGELATAGAYGGGMPGYGALGYHYGPAGCGGGPPMHGRPVEAVEYAVPFPVDAPYAVPVPYQVPVSVPVPQFVTPVVQMPAAEKGEAGAPKMETQASKLEFAQQAQKMEFQQQAPQQAQQLVGPPPPQQPPIAEPTAQQQLQPQPQQEQQALQSQQQTELTLVKQSTKQESAKEEGQQTAAQTEQQQQQQQQQQQGQGQAESIRASTEEESKEAAKEQEKMDMEDVVKKSCPVMGANDFVQSVARISEPQHVSALLAQLQQRLSQEQQVQMLREMGMGGTAADYKIMFQPLRGVQLDWLDIHYSVDGASLQNFRMKSFKDSAGNQVWEHAGLQGDGLTLASGQTLTYFFTYCIRGTDCDTPIFAVNA